MNGAMKVFSFIAPSPMNSFSADVKQFYTYLANSQGYPASNQNLIGTFGQCDALIASRRMEELSTGC